VKGEDSEMIAAFSAGMILQLCTSITVNFTLPIYQIYWVAGGIGIKLAQ